MCQKPYKAVGAELLVPNDDDDITMLVVGSGGLAGPFGVPPLPCSLIGEVQQWSLTPSENARLRVEGEAFSDVVTVWQSIASHA